MNEKIYYIVEIIIFSSLGVVALINPEFVAKNVLKFDSKMKRILLGIAALLNAARCLNELLK